MEKREGTSTSSETLEDRARKYNVPPELLREFQARVSDGMFGIPGLKTRDPKWIMKLVGIAREVGEDNALRMLSDYTHHPFPEGTKFGQALEQLPDIARERTINLLHKKLPVTNYYIKKIK